MRLVKGTPFWRYLTFTPVTFHMLFASISKPPIKYPNTQYEVGGMNIFLVLLAVHTHHILHAVYMLFASISKPQIMYPNTQYEVDGMNLFKYIILYPKKVKRRSGSRLLPM